MKTQPFSIALTATNAALLMFLLAEPHRTSAEDIPAVLRARAFEIVDDHGRIRAEIKVLPAEPTLKMPDGTTGYPEQCNFVYSLRNVALTVSLGPLRTGRGWCSAASQDSATPFTAGEPVVKLVGKDGRKQTIKP